MNRFGRSTHQRLKDRWGGGFILATLLAMLAAWYGGEWVAGKLGGDSDPAATSSPKAKADKGAAVGPMAEPQEFQLHFVQVGAFRSPAGAKREAASLAEKDIAVMVTPKDNKGFQKVWVGPFMDAKTAAEMQKELATDPKDAPVVNVSVGYNPDAIPVSAAGTTQSDFKKGMEAMSVYLQEVALLLENRAEDPMYEVKHVAEQGKVLSDLAIALNGATDSQAKALAEMCAAAGANALALEMAAAAPMADSEYQAAMTDYLALVNEYNTFHTAGK